MSDTEFHTGQDELSEIPGHSQEEGACGPTFKIMKSNGGPNAWYTFPSPGYSRLYTHLWGERQKRAPRDFEDNSEDIQSDFLKFILSLR